MHNYIDDENSDFLNRSLSRNFKSLIADVRAMDHMQMLAFEYDLEVILAVNKKQRDFNFIFLRNGKSYCKRSVKDVGDFHQTRCYLQMIRELSVDTLKMFVSMISDNHPDVECSGNSDIDRMLSRSIEKENRRSKDDDVDFPEEEIKDDSDKPDTSGIDDLLNSIAPEE